MGTATLCLALLTLGGITFAPVGVPSGIGSSGPSDHGVDCRFQCDRSGPHRSGRGEPASSPEAAPVEAVDCPVPAATPAPADRCSEVSPASLMGPPVRQWHGTRSGPSASAVR